MRRRTAFVVLTVLFGAGLGFGAFAFFGLVGPWFGVDGREVHRIHDLAWGAHGGLLIALPLLLQAAKPERKPALMLGASLAMLGLLAGYALGGVFVFLPIPVVVVAILWALHPARGEVLPAGRRPQPVLLAIAALAAIPLVLYALDEASVQRVCVAAVDQHCEEFHFSTMAALALALPLVAAGVSFRTPGWRAVAWLVGAAAGIFGLSAVLFPGNLSSPGAAWGSVALAGGVVFLAVAEWLVRRPVAFADWSPPALR